MYPGMYNAVGEAIDKASVVSSGPTKLSARLQEPKTCFFRIPFVVQSLARHRDLCFASNDVGDNTFRLHVYYCFSTLGLPIGTPRYLIKWAHWWHEIEHTHTHTHTSYTVGNLSTRANNTPGRTPRVFRHWLRSLASSIVQMKRLALVHKTNETKRNMINSQ